MEMSEHELVTVSTPGGDLHYRLHDGEIVQQWVEGEWVDQTSSGPKDEVALTQLSVTPGHVFYATRFGERWQWVQTTEQWMMVTGKHISA